MNKKHVTINGKTDDADIANEFAFHFSSLFYKSCNDILTCDEYKHESEDIHYVTNTVQCNISANVSVEIIDSVIRNLKFRKACGSDDLAADHLNIYNFPIKHLCILSISFAVYLNIVVCFVSSGMVSVSRY